MARGTGLAFIAVIVFFVFIAVIAGGDGVEEMEAQDLVEEGGVAGVALELAVTCLDLGDEVGSGDVVAGLEDVVDDGAQRVVVDA